MTEPYRRDGALAKVLLAISTFASDDDVILTLDRLYRQASQPFAGVAVVDSGRASSIPDLLATGRWPGLVYLPLATNVGSAGNLLRRCTYAVDQDVQYVYVVNHDGAVDVEAIRRLVDAAEGLPGAGAVYPLRYNSIRSEYDLTGKRRGPGTFIGAAEAPGAELVPVFWGSSNGALYAVQALREGVLPWGDLWMGWEDLELGLSLHRRGWTQYVVPHAKVIDDYEYGRRQMGSRDVLVSDKAAWYEYYSSRNLLLIARRHSFDLHLALAVGTRLLTNLTVIVLLKSDRRRRVALLARGLWHGLIGRTGKWKTP